MHFVFLVSKRSRETCVVAEKMSVTDYLHSERVSISMEFVSENLFIPDIYTGTILLFTLFDLDLDDVVRVALWLKLSLPGGKNISGSMLFTYMTELELK